MKDIETDTHVIYRMAKQMKLENKYIVDKKCIRDFNGVLAFNEEDKKRHGNSIMKGY